MLNLILFARLLDELFHCNRHFSIKGKLLFQTFLPKGLFSFWNHCPYSHVLSVPVESLGMSLLLPQHYLKNWLTFFIFHLQMKQSFFFTFCLTPKLVKLLLIFFWQKTVFLRLSVFSFFCWTNSSWAFFFICFISSLLRLFRARLWRLFASSDLFQLKKKKCRE